MRTELFDFDLPEDRIALRPASPRDAARLLVVRPGERPELEDRTCATCRDCCGQGDAIVVNDTKVFPASLHGRRIGRGEHEPAIAATLIKRLDGSRWRALVGRRSGSRQAMSCVSAAKARSVSSASSTPPSRPRAKSRRGRRGDVRVRVSRRSPRSGDGGARRHAAAALYRRPPCRRRTRPRRLPDHVRARPGLGRGADRGAAFHRSLVRRCARAASICFE